MQGLGNTFNGCKFVLGGQGQKRGGASVVRRKKPNLVAQLNAGGCGMSIPVTTPRPVTEDDKKKIDKALKDNDGKPFGPW